MLRRLLKGALIAAVALVVAIFGSGVMGLLSGNRPDLLGVHEGVLAPVNPDKQNSVSSFATTAYHRIDPLATGDDPPAGFARLTEIVARERGASIVESGPDYLYAEFATPMLGFVDDVEFLLDAKARRIDVRSASRLGRKDFGVNRKRIESIRASFASG